MSANESYERERAEALQRALYSRDPEHRRDMADRIIQDLGRGAELGRAERQWLLVVLSLLRERDKIPRLSKGRAPVSYETHLKRWGCMAEALHTAGAGENITVTIDRAATAAACERTSMANLYYSKPFQDFIADTFQQSQRD